MAAYAATVLWLTAFVLTSAYGVLIATRFNRRVREVDPEADSASGFHPRDFLLRPGSVVRGASTLLDAPRHEPELEALRLRVRRYERLGSATLAASAISWVAAVYFPNEGPAIAIVTAAGLLLSIAAYWTH